MSTDGGMTRPDDWSRAYAVQALSDLQARDILIKGEADECHQLHFLQMACEKLCKAHQCDHGTNPKDLQKSHAHIAKTLPIIVRNHAGLDRNLGWLSERAKHLAREI